MNSHWVAKQCFSFLAVYQKICFLKVKDQMELLCLAKVSPRFINFHFWWNSYLFLISEFLSIIAYYHSNYLQLIALYWFLDALSCLGLSLNLIVEFWKRASFELILYYESVHLIKLRKETGSAAEAQLFFIVQRYPMRSCLLLFISKYLTLLSLFFY